MATAMMVRGEDSSGAGVRREDYGYRRVQVPADVRVFPNEDVCFWRKPEVDNSRVARQADPKVWEACWRFFSAAAVVVVVVVGLLLPNAYGLLAGIRLEQLKERNGKLREELKRLEVVESRLTSPERLEQLARELNLVDAPPQGIIYLRGTSGQEVARLDAAR